MTSKLFLPCPSKSVCRFTLCTLIASIALLLAILRSTPSSVPRQLPVGNQPQPPRFGTLYVLSTTIITIVACAWSILYMNIPKSWERADTIRWRKIFWFALTILVPEMALAHEIVDRAAAVKSLHELRGARIETEDQDVKWTLTHSYYSNMYGLRFSVESGHTINTRQFIFLYRNKFTLSPSPQISVQEIKCNSRPNYLMKGVAVTGILHLIFSLFRKVRGGLPISLLEIFTLAFVACTISTIWFARQKPQNVGTPTIIENTRPFPHEDAITFNGMNTRSLSHGLTGSLSVPSTPWYAARLGNGGIEFPKGDVPSSCLSLAAIVVLSGIIHLTPWNFTFPTPVERSAWRAASSTMIILPILTTLVLLITRPSPAIREEIEYLEDNIISYSAEYCRAFEDIVNSRPEPRYSGVRLEDIRAHMDNRLEKSQHNVERAADFEWYNSLSRDPHEGAVGPGDRPDFPVPWGFQLIKGVWERRAGKLGRLEKLKLQLDLMDFGVRVLFMAARIYGVLRVLLLVLSIASLRRISDVVYGVTSVG